MAGIFAEVRVSVSVADERGWFALQNFPSTIRFEAQHGVELQRYAYNESSLAEVKKTRRALWASHAGYRDLFAPVGTAGPVTRFLVAGPVAPAVPSASELLDRWAWLCGRQGRLSDPEFGHYVSTALETPVLNAAQFKALETLSESLALLLASEGDAERVASKAWEAREVLMEAARHERMWDIARQLVDERTEQAWASHANRIPLEELGVHRAPAHVLVGLVSSHSAENELEQLLRRRELQRACVELAWQLGGVLAGQVGDHGVVFLLSRERSERTARARLLRIGSKAQGLAKSLGLALHLGLGPLTGSKLLSARYQSALSAAEQGLSTGRNVIESAVTPQESEGLLRDLRRKLARELRERPSTLAAHFARYTEAVTASSGYRLEPARAHLQAGLERLTEPLIGTGALDEKSARELHLAVDLAAKRALTMNDLVTAYRAVVSDIEDTLRHSGGAHQDRSLRRAIAFVKEHANEALDLASVAKIAGFAPNYFARLFKEREGTTFARYVRKLRLEQAARMLERTPLTIARVGQLAGFSSKHHFHRLFKQTYGMTPDEFRERHA